MQLQVRERGHAASAHAAHDEVVRMVKWGPYWAVPHALTSALTPACPHTPTNHPPSPPPSITAARARTRAHTHTLFYHHPHLPSPPLQANDVFFSLHAVAITLITLIQVCVCVCVCVWLLLQCVTHTHTPPLCSVCHLRSAVPSALARP